MPTRVTYETTTPPTSIDVGSGPNAANLGKRNSTTLGDAFATPNGTGNVSRITEASQIELLRIAKEKLSTYAGENTMFPQYRRNFVPGGERDLTAEYEAARDKNTVVPAVGSGLGTAYSPTIASPGEAAGINPSNLAVVVSNVNSAAITPLDNPSAAVHQNNGFADSSATPPAPGAGNTGAVRRFNLGVGSGGADATTPAASRGQFPRPLT